MKVLIVEVEKPAAERLKTLLMEYDSRIVVMACFDSVSDTVQYLKTKTHPDLVFMDIHLSDGQSFEIFKQYHFTKPVIFTTAYAEFALEAFKVFSIDYILKPVTIDALAAALNKLKSLRSYIHVQDHEQALTHRNHSTAEYRKRFLGKSGQRIFFIGSDTVSFFEADDKIVYLFDRKGHHYLFDETIEKLEAHLNPKEYFRINRSTLVHIDAIEHVRPFFSKRLRLHLKGAADEKQIVVSRERVAEFRHWAAG